MDINETQEQAKSSKAMQDLRERLRERDLEEIERYSTRDDLMQKITTMLMTELVERHDRKQHEYHEFYEEEYTGVWFGLQSIGQETLDWSTRLFRSTYRMDDDLCETLRVPHATTCHAVYMNSEMINFYIAGFHHGVQELHEIKKLLDTVVTAQLVKCV
jgi:hypothetical protein